MSEGKERADDTYRLMSPEKIYRKIVKSFLRHNFDIIKTADHLIDLGPEGGNRGGKLVAQGTPEQVAKIKASYTGQF